MQVDRILGYTVLTEDAQMCAGSIAAWIATGTHCRWLACINPHSYVVALEQPEFSEALRSADWLVPDGIGLVLASRLLGGGIRTRLTGSDIFFAVNERLNCSGTGRVFFLGASEEALEDIRRRMARDYPNLNVVGTYSPPFKPKHTDAEIEDMVAVINGAEPDVLWVGMTSPKQDLWIYRCRERLNVKFAAGVGAVFDFYSGRVKRSHPIFQRMGLEWLPRFMQQPRRLWRRMFISAPVFVWHVLKEKATH